MGAPKGNQNHTNGRIWAQAIERALARRKVSRGAKIKALDALADKLIDLGMDGDLQALKELGDRLDGKPAQAITGEGGGPVAVTLHPLDTLLTA